MSEPIVTHESESLGYRTVEKQWTYEALLELFDHTNGNIVAPLVRRCQAYEAEIERLKADLETFGKDAARLDWLGLQDGCGLVSDDAGHWAVSGSGMQNVPDTTPIDLATTYIVMADEWKANVREAIDAAILEYAEIEESCGGDETQE